MKELFTINDIDVFIMTHNRANYLKQSLDSILNQTIKPVCVTVLDNESTDNTEDIVKGYESRNVKYVKTLGFLGNFNKARELVKNKYCILFHDDDVLNPFYFEYALKAINSYSDVSQVLTRYLEFTNSNLPVDYNRKCDNRHVVFNTQKQFAIHMYFHEVIAYATAIYRTNDFLSTDIEYEKYNKFNDWPFMVKIANKGKTVLFDDGYLFHLRRHSGQDTWTYTNVPTIQQIVNWDKCFFSAMKLSNFSLSVLNKMFNNKAKIFMKGKYDAFLPPEYKIEHSVTELQVYARKIGLEVSFDSEIQTNNIVIKSINKIFAKIYRKIEKKIFYDTYEKLMNKWGVNE